MVSMLVETLGQIFFKTNPGFIQAHTYRERRLVVIQGDYFLALLVKMRPGKCLHSRLTVGMRTADGTDLNQKYWGLSRVTGSVLQSL